MTGLVSTCCNLGRWSGSFGSKGASQKLPYDFRDTRALTTPSRKNDTAPLETALFLWDVDVDVEVVINPFEQHEECNLHRTIGPENVNSKRFDRIANFLKEPVAR